MAREGKSSNSASYLLGIDIGTSTVKVVLVEKSTFRVVEERSHSLEHVTDAHAQGDSTSSSSAVVHERSANEIFSCLESCVSGLDAGLLCRVCSIGVCGQMHGCILWKSTERLWQHGQLHAHMAETCTNLITWQDGRCTPEFLSSLPKTDQKIPTSSGYGCATLAWLAEFQPKVVEAFDRAGTIMDLTVYALTSGGQGLSGEAQGRQVVMSAQNAASWGYFDIQSLLWEKQILQERGFPGHLLPSVVSTPHQAGVLTLEWHGVPRDTPIGVAMGDLQCSILAAQPSTTDAVLNIGTASQLVVFKPSCTEILTASSSGTPSLVEVPYFNGGTILVAAALGGGNVVATFVTMLREWMAALGLGAEETNEAEIYDKLITLAEEKPESSLEVDPVLWGERHAPEVRGTVSNIRADNLSLADVSSAMFSGIAKNLRRMMPAVVFQQCNVQQILGSGHTLQRNLALRRQIERIFGLPLVVREGTDAPLGAAMAVQPLS